jgi:hypothetical protein
MAFINPFLVRLGLRTPPVIKAEPAPEPSDLARALRRFSTDELNVAMGEAWRAGIRRAEFPTATRLAMQEIARFRREKNRLARKQSKPAPAPPVFTNDRTNERRYADGTPAAPVVEATE